jgi:Zn-dependent peptidase ImmA (M78 family)
MFNPKRLAVARKRHGWTLTKLSEETGLSTKSLSTYENGHQEPAEPTVALLADKLGVTERFLFGDDLEEIPLGSVSFRALSKMTARTRDKGLNSALIAFMLDEWVQKRFTMPAPDLPTLTGRDPQIAAYELRVRWGLGEQPITNMVHLLESHGVRVYSLPPASTDLDAFCLYWHSQPFVFLGTDKSGERSRFDAAHELGHLVIHGEDRRPHGQEAEQEANRFAAEFLMPPAAVLAQGLRNATMDTILVAKKQWNVAAMAMAHRANELGLMTEWGYRSLCVDLSRRGYRRIEPDGIARESSLLWTKVLRQLRESGIGLGDIADDLGLVPTEVQAHMFGLTPTLISGGGQLGAGGRAPTLSLVD